MKVKIIATLGPSSSTYEIMRSMVLEGVSGFRINFSHGSIDEWKRYVKIVRKIEEELKKPICLSGDLKGGSMRIGYISGKIKLKKNLRVKIVKAERSTGEFIPIPSKEFYETVDKNDVILMDDGNIMLKILEKNGSKIEVKALTPGTITSRKALVVRGKEFNLPALTEEDVKSIKFAVKHSLEYIGLSYVRSSEDVKKLRKILLEEGGEDIGIMAKIETVSGVKNLKRIIDVSDIILVARGDLGMQFPLEEVPVIQRRIVKESISKGKPVIVATQILASMINNPTPTRAEVSDIATAIMEGVDAIMLTGETAIGKYPVEAVKWLKRTILKNQNYIVIDREEIKRRDPKMKFAYSIALLTENLKSKLAIYTQKGRTATRISIYRPKIEMYAASNNEKTLRKTSILWGVKPLRVQAEGYVDGIEKTYQELCSRGLIKRGEVIVLTYGLIEEEEHIIKIKRY